MSDNLNPLKKTKRVLVVEDSESKFKEIEDTLSILRAATVIIVRAPTVLEAESLVVNEDWDLIVLDVSMDITDSKTGPKRGGHDALGGLRIANKMFLLGREFPTVILTAFDAFPSDDGAGEGQQILGLDAVKKRASETLGELLVGCVRYGDANWKIDFSHLATRVLSQ